jgi:hypothetical protein
MLDKVRMNCTSMFSIIEYMRHPCTSFFDPKSLAAVREQTCCPRVEYDRWQAVYDEVSSYYHGPRRID